MRLGKIAKQFTEKGAVGNPPKFVIIMGGVSSGKTTWRRKDFVDGYVNLDYWDVYLAVEKEFGKDDLNAVGYVSLVGDMILFESIEAKKNIVIEIIGAEENIFKPVIDKMKELGYDLAVHFVACGVEQAIERHLKAVQNDKDYQSAHYTERPTLLYFFRYLKLGDMPNKETGQEDGEVDTPDELKGDDLIFYATQNHQQAI